MTDSKEELRKKIAALRVPIEIVAVYKDGTKMVKESSPPPEFVEYTMSLVDEYLQSLLAEIAERGPKDVEITDDGMMPAWANIKATGFNEANTEWRKLLTENSGREWNER